MKCLMLVAGDPDAPADPDRSGTEPIEEWVEKNDAAGKRIIGERLRPADTATVVRRRDGKVLVPNNGAYCARIVKILKYLGRAHSTIDIAEDRQASAAMLEGAFRMAAAITHVAQVHCETGTGILNPLPEIAEACARHHKGLIVDAMSSFAALPIDAREVRFDALVAASGKCLEGVPGMGFVFIRKDVIDGAAGNSHSLAMDLHDQHV